MPRPSRRRSPWRCCPLGSGRCLILPGMLKRWYPARSPGGKSSRDPAWDGGAGGRRWARSGLLASAASPSPFLVLLLHGPRVSEKPRATAPGAERPAGESCCPNSPERLPHSSSGQMRKWGGNFFIHEMFGIWAKRTQRLGLLTNNIPLLYKLIGSHLIAPLGEVTCCLKSPR